jgi:fibronectin type 3 domain-containing protein
VNCDGSGQVVETEFRKQRAGTILKRQKAKGHPDYKNGFAFCLLLFALCLLPFLCACGKPGAPIPPARLTERATDLSAIQRGPKIILNWSLPALNKREGESSYIARVEVYRLIERRDEEPVLDSIDFETAAATIGELDRATIEALAQTTGNLQFTDSINAGQPSADVRWRYAVRYFNKRGQKAAFSNTVVIEPVAVIAAQPTALRAANQGQGEVLIEWNGAATNIDGSTPAAVVGYNLYRVRANRKLDRGKPLNEEPITDTKYIDRTFQYKNEYTYLVRTLSQGISGLIESADSELVNFTPVDTFAPPAPDPVSIASANGTISLFWPTSPAPDVTGYFIYRTENQGGEENDWVKLNGQPVKEVTYHDTNVAIDKKYFYRVTAIDNFKNESPPSKAVSETAHP